MTDFGYIRVSSRDQNEDRQVIAMREAGIEQKNIYLDKQSGKNFDRQNYKKLLNKIKKGDCLFIKSIDRLGRNYDEIIEQWQLISKKKGADIVVLDMPILDTREEKNLIGRFISDIVLQILSFVAENERIAINQRQKEGIAAAKAKGVSFGRKQRPMPDNFQEVVEQFKNGELTTTAAAKVLGLPVSTFRDRMKALGISAPKPEQKQSKKSRPKIDPAELARQQQEKELLEKVDLLQAVENLKEQQPSENLRKTFPSGWSYPRIIDEKVCPGCGRTFTPNASNQKYCSAACAKLCKRQRAAEKKLIKS